MSFASDLFEGNFSNLGTDLEHAPSSLANHPEEIGELGAAALAIAAPFALPEIGAALGATELGLGAADLGAGAAEAGLGLGEAAGAGADLGLGAAEGAGLAEGAAGAADLGLAAEGADLGLGAADLATAETAADLGLASSGGLGADVLGFAPGVGEFGLGGDTSVFAPEIGDFAGSSAGDFGTVADVGAGPGPDAGPIPSDTGPTGPGNLPSGPGGVDTQPASLDAANKAFGKFDPGGFASNVSNAGTGGFLSNLSNTLGLGGMSGADWLKLGAGVAPLALTLGMGEPKLPGAANQAQAQAMQLSQQGMADLANARAGNLNAGQTAQLAQMRNNAENQWRQTLYNQGVTDVTKDSRWPQIQTMIDQQVTAATATMIQQNITNALQETGQAASTLTAVANMQLQEDQAFTNNLIGATKSLGFAAGSGAFKVVQA